MAVTAVAPWTPARANALRSAWIPAPPPESDPAIDRQTGMERGSADTAPRIGRRPRSPRRHHHVAPARYAPQAPGELELRERRERRLRLVGRPRERGERVAPAGHRPQQRREPRLEPGGRVRGR